MRLCRIQPPVQAPCSRHHRQEGAGWRVHSHLADTGDPVQGSLDANELITALNNAIAAEDYQLAAQLRDRLRQLAGSDTESIADWSKLGILPWLSDRAERIGFRFPTGDSAQHLI